MELANFIYCEQKNLIFTYVPKVACTNWKCVFRYMNGSPDYLNNSLAHDRNKSGLTYLDQLQDPLNVLNDSTIKKYTFVRNPYSRILSAYRNKIERWNGTNEYKINDDFWAKVYHQIFNDTIEIRTVSAIVDFSSFLWWLMESKHEFTKNEHWQPQSEIVDRKRVSYDFIGKFENIDQDADYILNEIGCDIAFPTQSQVKFPGTHATSLVDKYYDSIDYERVNFIYSNDFIHFNYEVIH